MNPAAGPAARLRALNGIGILAYRQLDYPKALACFHECIEISRALDDQHSLATALTLIGNVYGNQSRYDLAEGYWKQALEIWQAKDAPADTSVLSGMAALMDNLGNIAYSRRQNQEARDYYHQGYKLRIQIGNPGLAAYSLVNMGTLELAIGNRKEALGHFHEGLAISHGLKDHFSVGYFLFGLADLAQPQLAARLLGRFDQIREDIEISLNEEETAAYRALVEKLQSAMSPADYATALDEGRKMDLDQAVEEALSIELE
ncbi:MAG: tetratricopeptide repeat protein [Fimbriimonas sp.]